MEAEELLSVGIVSTFVRAVITMNTRTIRGIALSNVVRAATETAGNTLPCARFRWSTLARFGAIGATGDVPFVIAAAFLRWNAFTVVRKIVTTFAETTGFAQQNTDFRWFR